MSRLGARDDGRPRTQNAASAGRGRGWAFIDAAATGNNAVRAYGLALLAIIVVPSAMALALVLTAGGGRTGTLIQQFGPIAVAGGVVLWAVERLHRRPWRSVVAADRVVDGHRLAIGAGVQFAIMGTQLLLVDWLSGWRLDLTLWLSGTAGLTALCLIPLQAAGEELLCRGYLTQALGRLIRSRIVIALVVGAIFGALHFNTRGWLTLPYFMLLSLFFSLVTLRDEGLEIAIGGHAALNLFAYAAANSGIVAPAAIGDTAAAMPFNAAAILVLAVDGALFYGLTRLFVRLFCRPR